MMMTRRGLALFLVLCLVMNAACVPATYPRLRRGLNDNKVDSKESKDDKSTSLDKESDDDDFEAEFNKSPPPPPAGGGSNIFSLLNLASALFPASSIKKLIQDLVRMNRVQVKLIQDRKDKNIADNEIDIDYTVDLKPPPFEKQEIDETDSESDESSASDEDNGAEESVEKESTENGGSKQDSSDGDDNDSDYDEPPEGDGQGGGILGLLAGLSGDGESDLGTLLATVGGIVANLSGDGVDINALIATGLGLFVGLLSEGAENPGEIIASYLLTSLETITGGGAKNNGEFFGKFLSKLVKGTSAGGDPDASSSEEANGMKMADSAGFFASLLMGLLGDMSKSSSGGWH
ncbi:unnamed protein product [Chrysodeixis includens]|uniref:Uncharacterized protein n=1 Tax=Chrysodeixis includens TaxID=689277 RepID=A0A9P0BWJ3_CHRIL|nr:unnamed protein product [Chrysodeixis includens]